MECTREIVIRMADPRFEREPLIRPFGFKGGQITELWQSVVRLESDSGCRAIGLGTQSVLWADAAVFAGHAEAEGNALMYALTGYALRRVRGAAFRSPPELLDEILEDTWEYGRRITNNAGLKKTFALNALVPLDNAAWLLYARENGLAGFDEMIPDKFRAGLAHHHTRVALVPLLDYSAKPEEIVNKLGGNCSILKVKIGMPGSQEEMLEKDKSRLGEVQRAVEQRESSGGSAGRIMYYLDANGRYESRDRLLKLLEQADRTGALGRIILLEEPFPVDSRLEAGDLGVRIAADESACDEVGTAGRIALGYGAVALKPAAKTLSLTLGIIRAARERAVPCFCADLTVNPVLVDWNKNVAARLAPLPGLESGLLEVNGPQNYRRWEELRTYHPCAGAGWTIPGSGVFELDRDFYDRSGGIFEQSAHYLDLFRR